MKTIDEQLTELKEWSGQGYYAAAEEQMAGEAAATIELLLKEIERLRGARKDDCVDFFRWWWNQPGNDTEAGYDTWLALKQEES